MIKKKDNDFSHIILKTQVGRSMVEMLGVLAIIGVLSASALSGYSKAMQKHKMNQFTDDFNYFLANAMSFSISAFTNETFDESSLTELSESIKEHGVIQPIIVTKKGDLYTIIAGERRWRAAKMAGLTSIPAIVRDYAPKEAMEIAIIENIQRKDLNPIEEAMAYQSLIEEYNITQDDVAARLSKSRSVIANSWRLLTLTKKVKELLVEGLLSAGHGRSLASIKDEKSQNALADKIIKEGLTVRDVEKLLSNKTNGNASKKVSSKKIEFNDDFIYEDMVKRLEKRLGTKVKIKRATKDKGELIIEYYSPLEFEQLFKHINR